MKDRIFRDIAPLNQLIDDVLVDPEWEDVGHDVHGEALLGIEPGYGFDLIDLPLRIDAEFTWEKSVARGQCRGD